MVGLERTLAKLYGIDVGLIDLTIPLTETKRYLHKRFAYTFAKGGEEPKWKRVKASTMRLRTMNKRRTPLVDKGTLLRALISPTSRYAKHKVFKKKLRFAISSTLKYADYMEKGVSVSNGWGRGIHIEVPARPFMHLVKRDTAEINKIFHGYMERIVRYS